MQSMWTASRDRSNNRGVASFSLHFYLLFCKVCLTPMRFPRIKAEGQSFYHCVSRVVDRQFIFQTAGHGSPEAERFVLPMRRLEAFSGVRVLTYSLMSNHFHLLCEVPQAQRSLCPMVQPPSRSIWSALGRALYGDAFATSLMA